MTKDTSALSADEPTPANYNPYSYPPPSFGMPFGGIPPHLMPHMAQMMQNGLWRCLSNFSLMKHCLCSGFSGFGSIPPPAHLLRFMMPPAVNPTAVPAGKSLETLQTELRKVGFWLAKWSRCLIWTSVLNCFRTVASTAERTGRENAESQRRRRSLGRIQESRRTRVLLQFQNNGIEMGQANCLEWCDRYVARARDLWLYLLSLDVQNQLEQINKTMHESEKELKRLESEQSQLALSTGTSNDKQSAQAQPQVAAAPTFVNGFTLEKLDNNDLRRFVSIHHSNIIWTKTSFSHLGWSFSDIRSNRWRWESER